MTTFTKSQLTVEDLLGQSVVTHFDQVTGPSQLVCLDHGWDTRHLGTLKHINICDPILPSDSYDAT